jgi:proline iminopeptidase
MEMRRTLMALVAVAVAFPARAADPPQAAKPTLESYFASNEPGMRSGGVRRIPIKTPKGEFTVWTKRFGHNPRIKVLLLHGGPAATHEYFESFEGFLPQAGIEFIYYDQLGSAYSDQPKDDSLWTIERFVDEVEQVRIALGLGKDDFYLLGHSWGGMLAMEYALAHQQHLKGLVISNMMASIPDYNRYADQVLAKRMDPAVVKEVKDLVARGQYDSPRYMELLIPNFYVEHILHRPFEQWPDSVLRAFNKLNRDIYVTMQGPSEFGASGRLEKWDRKADLPKITVPTLVIGGRHDTMDPEHMKWIAGQVKNGRFLYCPEGAHMAMWDDQQAYFKGLLAFLQDVDAGRKP